MALFFLSLAIFALVILMMSIGVMMGRARIKGSCGGPDGCEICLFKHDGQCPRRLEQESDDPDATSECPRQCPR